MEDKTNVLEKELETPKQQAEPELEDWHTQALEDLEEFIESQGIYIRQ